MIPQPIDQVPLFLRLSEEERAIVTARLHRRQLAPGELIFTAKQPSEALYVVVSGWVRLEDATSDRSIAIANVGAGSLLGEVDTLLGRPYSTSARSASATQLLSLTRTDLEMIIDQHPKIGLKLSAALGMRIAFLEPYLVQQRLRNIELLSGLAEDDLGAIARCLDFKSFSRGEQIIDSGAPAEAAFIIEEGRVRLMSASRDGDSFEEVGEGGLIGHTALITGKPHSTSARAITDVTAWYLARSVYKEIIRDRASVKLAFSRALAETLSPNDQADAIERMRQLSLFADIPTEALGALSSRLVLRHFPSGEVIYTEATPGDALYVIEAGEVKLLESSAPDAPLVERIRAGSSFGEMALLTGRTRAECARAASDATVWVLYKTDFDDLMVRYPEISVSLSRNLTERLRSKQGDFLERHLRQIPLFSNLATSELRSISAKVRGLRFRPGEIICFAGQPAQTLYIVEMGEVRLMGSGGAGDPIAVDLLGPGDTFGEQAIVQRSTYPATAQAIGDVELWTIAKKDFDVLLEQFPGLALAVTRTMADRLSRSQQIPSITGAGPRANSPRLLRSGSQRSAQGLQSPVPPPRSAPVAPPLQTPTTWPPAQPGRIKQPPSGARPIPKPAPAHTEQSDSAFLPQVPPTRPAAPVRPRLAQPPAPTPTAPRPSNENFKPHPVVTATPTRPSRTADRTVPATQPRVLPPPPKSNASPHTPTIRPQSHAGPVIQRPSTHAGQVPHRQTAPAQDTMQIPPAPQVPMRPDVKPNPPAAFVRSAAPVARKKRARAGTSFLSELGEWLANLSFGAKIRMMSVGVLSVWVLFIALPATALNTVSSAVGGLQILKPTSGENRPLVSQVTTPTRTGDVRGSSESNGGDGGSGSPGSSVGKPKIAMVVFTATRVPTKKPTATKTPRPKPTAVPATRVPTAPPPPPPAVPVAAVPLPPTATAPAPALAPVDWDPRLGNGPKVLPHLESVRLIPATVPHGQKFWRAIRVKFEDISESGNDHTIYVKIVDQNGKRVDAEAAGVKAHLTSDGGLSEYPEQKPEGDLCDCNFNYPMYGDGYAFNIEGKEPSDKVAGMIMPMRRHVNYRITFQLVTNP